jgi:ABC-2 type transport system permease protein
VRLFAGGSTLSLLAHELRLVWRGRGKRPRNRARLIFLLVGVGVLGFGLGMPFALLLNTLPDRPSPEFALGIDAALAALLILMLSQTISASALNFYERGDLDLLLSSPIPPQRVLTVRCLGMALTACLAFMLFATPVVGPAIVLGHWKWLCVYPVLFALGLFATAVGLMIATGLFKLIGPKRTRALAQVMAAVIGATIFLVVQTRNFLPRAEFERLWRQAIAFANSGPFGPDQPLTWPARAVMGEPVPALVMLAIGFVLFLLVVRSLGRRFAADAAAAAGVGSGRARAAKGGVSGFNGGPFRAMLRKELRLLRRDPALLSQVLLRVVYFVPLGFILLSGGRAGTAMGSFGHYFTPGPDYWIARGGALLVFVTTQLAGTLAWITISAEDAPELLATAPERAGLLRRAKLTAALTPVLVILAIPLGYLIYLRPLAGAITAAGCVAAAVSACLIAVWYEKPAKRSDLRRRRSGSLLGALAETFVGFCWSTATWLAAEQGLLPDLHLVLAAIPAGMALLVLIAIRRPERSFVETLELA